MSLNGRDAVTQNKRRRCDDCGDDDGRSSARDLRLVAECAQDAIQQEQGACARQAGNDGHRDRVASREVRRERRHDHRHCTGERDEERIARRVWLVSGDVVVTQAEREIDRVDVLEVAGQPREVETDEERGHRQHEPVVEGSAAHPGR